MALEEREAFVGMRWREFLEWFRVEWKPGQHVCLVGPTGLGKTTLAVGILPLRRYVLALDPKGGDDTLQRLRRYGFERIETWPPPRKIRKAIEEGKPARLIVGGMVKERKDRPALKKTLQAALGDAFDEGNWTVYVDELQIAGDRRFMDLGADVELNMIAARNRGISMVTSFQRPANVPRAASDQARWLFVWYTRDVDVVNRLAEMAGRPKAEIRGAINGLGDYCVLLFSQNPRQPIVVTRPDEV